MRGYPVDLTPDDNDTYLVTSPDFPELTTYGDDERGAVAAASRAIEEAIAARIVRGADVPAPRGFIAGGKPFVRLTR